MGKNDLLFRYDKVVKEAYFIKNYSAMDIKKTIFVKNRLMNLIIL